MKKIIFVCTGATCRSPMACLTLKNKLKMLGITGIEVDYAGVNANIKDPIATNVKKVLKSNGIKVGRQYAHQLKRSMVTDDTMIICMSNKHKAYLKNINARVISMEDLVGGVPIEDPYGGDISVYTKCYNIINFMLDEIIDMIKKENRI